jgi:5-methylcytosine-specific restriction endonuclease McrA
LCNACYQRVLYAANPDKGRERAKAWREANPEKQKAQDAAWYAKNAEYKKAKKRAEMAAETSEQREARLAYAREYNPKHYAANREARIQATLDWQKANPERANTKATQWAKANPEKRRAVNQEYKKENPAQLSKDRHARRARKTQTGGFFTVVEWTDLLTIYGRCCPGCGIESKLSVDHITPIKHGGTSDISNLQPLCTGCNSAKGSRYISHYAPWDGTAPRLLAWVDMR